MDKIRQNKGGLMILGALILLTVVFFVTKEPKEDVVVNDDVLDDGKVGGDSSSDLVQVPMPDVSSWIPKEVTEDKLTLDIPTEYYVSKPRIDDCDVTSISTTSSNGKPISIALVYNVGCDNADLTTGAAKSVEKNGYVFRTNYTAPSVIAIFDKIVASAK